MRYVVNDEVFTDEEEAVNYCIQDNYHDRYDSGFEDWVNEEYYNESGTYFSTHYTAYELAVALDILSDLEEEYQECENERDRQDALYELGRADNGETVWCQGYEIVVEDDEEDEEYEEDPDLVVDRLNACRERIAMNYQQQNEEKIATKQSEDDILNMFQVVGA